MKITILTIFPEMFDGPLGVSMIKRAQEQGLVSIEIIDFREYAFTKHKNVDDEPFGGGAGMLLKPEPIYEAVEASVGPKDDFGGKVILMTPQGEPFSQKIAWELSKEEELVFICGHYEGFDERVLALADRELSIGDYVLTGGELPAMVVIDSLCRLIPGVLGGEDSHLADSFSDGLLEHPHYTRPREYKGMVVPEVLLNGNHEEIRKWRRKESLRRTWLRRRELLEKIELTKEDRRFIEEICGEESDHGE